MPKICNTAWKSLRRRELSPAQFDAIVDDVAQPFSRLVPIEGLIRPAAALTRRLDHPVYDCLYLALAENRDSVMVTADRRFHEAVRASIWADRLVWIEDVP